VGSLDDGCVVAVAGDAIDLEEVAGVDGGIVLERDAHEEGAGGVVDEEGGVADVDVGVEIGGDGGEVDGDAGGGLLWGEGVDSAGGGERRGFWGSGRGESGERGCQGEEDCEEQCGTHGVTGSREVKRGISPGCLRKSREL